MAEKIIISKNSLIKAIDIFIIIILFFGFGYFVKDVFEKFHAKETSFTQTVIKNDEIDAPTFSICFNPPLKKTKIEQYNLESNLVGKSFGFGNSNTFDSSYKIPKIFNESTYQIGVQVQNMKMVFNISALDIW